MSSTIKSEFRLSIDDDPSIDTDALRMAGTLTLVVRLLDGALRHAEIGDGLTISEMSVLAHVHRGNDLPSVIARTLRLDPARVTRITDRLFGLGYLDREDDPADRRRCVLRITPGGMDRLAGARAELSSAMTSMLDVLTTDERVSLMRNVESVRRVLDEG